MLTYYPDRSSPLLVKIGSQGVTGAALRCGIYVATEASLPGPMEGGSVGYWELRTVALLKAVWWGMRLASVLTHLLAFSLHHVVILV